MSLLSYFSDFPNGFPSFPVDPEVNPKQSPIESPSTESVPIWQVGCRIYPLGWSQCEMLRGKNRGNKSDFLNSPEDVQDSDTDGWTGLVLSELRVCERTQSVIH